jgi:hypothetical protein
MSTPTNGNIKLSVLYERTGKSGKKYMIGRWGKTRVLAFPASPTEDGTPTWSLELQEAGDYVPYASQKPQERPSQSEKDLVTLFGKPI